MFTALSLPLSTSESYETGHGRCEFRHVELYANEADLPNGWNGIQRIVKVRRWGTRQGKPFEEVSFYVMSKPIYSAYSVAKGIRGHWGIENGLHWTKDVIMGEDDMTLVHPNGATAIGYLNTAAINLLRLAGYKPIKDTFAKFTNKVKELNFLFQIYT